MPNKAMFNFNFWFGCAAKNNLLRLPSNKRQTCSMPA